MGQQIAQKAEVMKLEEIQKLIEEINTKLNALAEQILTLATTVNQLSKALLEFTRNDESREASNRLLEAYLQHSMNYRNYAATTGRWTLAVLAAEEAQDLMTAATAEGRSAVDAIAELVVRESRRRGKEITDATTKFVGLVVSFLMESNGYRQTGKVGPVHSDPFTKGQIYQLIES